MTNEIFCVKLFSVTFFLQILIIRRNLHTVLCYCTPFSTYAYTRQLKSHNPIRNLLPPLYVVALNLKNICFSSKFTSTFSVFHNKINLYSFKMASASSMPPLDQKRELKSLLECPICLETFDDPRTLPCLHSFCMKCLENFVERKHEADFKCPVCRCKFTLDEEGKIL